MLNHIENFTFERLYNVPGKGGPVLEIYRNDRQVLPSEQERMIQGDQEKMQNRIWTFGIGDVSHSPID
jgi:hypothetical protein